MNSGRRVCSKVDASSIRILDGQSSPAKRNSLDLLARFAIQIFNPSAVLNARQEISGFPSQHAVTTRAPAPAARLAAT